MAPKMNGAKRSAEAAGCKSTSVDEARGQLSKLYTSKNRLYILSIFIFFVACFLSLPFRFHSHVLNMIDSKDRHYIFLLCNGILLFLFFDSGLSQTQPRLDDAMTRVYVNDQHEPMVKKEVEHDAIMVTSVVQEEMKTEQIEHQIQDPDSQLVVLVDHVDNEDEIVANAEVDDDEFNQKCQAFIEKVRRSMHHENPSNSHI